MRVTMRRFPAVAVLLALFLIPAVVVSRPRARGDTDEFRAFLKERGEPRSRFREAERDGITYRLENGVLSFGTPDGPVFWSSDPFWSVDDFALGDVDGNGTTDCLFSLWKSYRFYEGSGREDDPAVRNHLFLYTVISGRAKALWCSSDLPRPILDFSLEPCGADPLSSGILLRTAEGRYGGSARTRDCAYRWRGWGFVPVG